MRRTIWNWRSLRTSDLSIKTPDNLEDSQCVPCHLIATLYQKQNIWKQLPQTTTWITWRRRSIWSGNNPQTPMKRKRIPILCEMERISNHWSNMGIWISLLRWWKHAPKIDIKSDTKRISFHWTIETKEIWNNKPEHIYKQEQEWPSTPHWNHPLLNEQLLSQLDHPLKNTNG